MPVNVRVRVERLVDVEVDVPESEIANGIRDAIKAAIDAGAESNGGNVAGHATSGSWWRTVLAALRT